jgi:exonuclease VII small subunit
MTVIDAFFTLEKMVAGYNDYIDCSEESFKKTLESLENLVTRIQQGSYFSKNESLKDF